MINLGSDEQRMQPNSEQRNGGLFKAAFLRLLLDRFPPWRSYISESAETYTRIEISPPNWDGPPFCVDIHPPDTVTVSPLCNFGLDYISTATKQDLEERSDLVFAKVLTDIADFVSGRTVVAIRRHKFLFMKAGWDVRFVPITEMEQARRSGASIAAWPVGR
jgi:hypothetical protein